MKYHVYDDDEVHKYLSQSKTKRGIHSHKEFVNSLKSGAYGGKIIGVYVPKKRQQSDKPKKSNPWIEFMRKHKNNKAFKFENGKLDLKKMKIAYDKTKPKNPEGITKKRKKSKEASNSSDQPKVQSSSTQNRSNKPKKIKEPHTETQGEDDLDAELLERLLVYKNMEKETKINDSEGKKIKKPSTGIKKKIRFADIGN